MSTQVIDADFEALLEFLRASRAFDFTGYKRPSLQRRIAKRRVGNDHRRILALTPNLQPQKIAPTGQISD